MFKSGSKKQNKAEAASAKKAAAPSAVVVDEVEVKKPVIVKHNHYSNTPNLIKVRVYGESSKGRYPTRREWCPKCDPADIKKDLMEIVKNDGTILNKLATTYIHEVDKTTTFDVTQDSDIKVLMELIPFHVKHGGKIYLRIVSSSTLLAAIGCIVLLIAAFVGLWYLSGDSGRLDVISCFIGAIMGRAICAAVLEFILSLDLP